MKILFLNEFYKFKYNFRNNIFKSLILFSVILLFNFLFWRNANLIELTTFIVYSWNKYVLYLIIFLINIGIMFFSNQYICSKEMLFQLKINKFKLVVFSFFKLVLMNVLLFNSLLYFWLKIDQVNGEVMLFIILINTLMFTKNFFSLLMTAILSVLFWILLVKWFGFIYVIPFIQFVAMYFLIFKEIKLSFSRGNLKIHPRNKFFESIIYVLRCEKNFKLLVVTIIFILLSFILPENIQIVILSSKTMKSFMENYAAKGNIFVRYPNITLVQILFMVSFVICNFKLFVVTRLENSYTKLINPNVYSNYFTFIFIFVVFSTLETLFTLPFSSALGLKLDLNTSIVSLASMLLWTPFALLFITIFNKRNVVIIVALIIIYMNSSSIISLIHFDNVIGSSVLLLLEILMSFMMIQLTKTKKISQIIWN